MRLPMSDRNPSPPADFSNELVTNVDQIGDTAYSKRWLFALLMDLLKLTDTELHENANETDVAQLNGDMEEQLCCLWDLTINTDVLPHLDEFNLLSILTNALYCHRYPRLLEISVGILANAAYSGTMCLKMSENESFVNRIIELFYSRDTPTLTEVCRLVQTVLAWDDYSGPWLDAIRFQSDFIENILFILQSSTNGGLLIATIRLVDAITRKDDSLAEIWCGVDLLNGILVAQRQMEWLHGNEVEIIQRLFYTFSSNTSGVQALMKTFASVLSTFGVYLRKVCEDEPHVIPFTIYYNSLRAIIPVIDAVVASLPSNESVACLASDRSVLPCLLHITVGCQQQLEDMPLLRGLLVDLGVLYKDLIQSIHATLSILTSSSDDLTTIDTLYAQDWRWFCELDEDINADKREAFLNCLLEEGSADTRNQLLFLCNRLKLPVMLESLTDDC